MSSANGFAQIFQEGGIWMLPLLVLGGATWAFGIIAALVRGRPLAFTALALAALTITLGVLGWAAGMSDLEAALATISPEQAAMATEIGSRIAAVPLRFAALGAAPGVLGGLVGLFVPRRPRTPPTLGPPRS